MKLAERGMKRNAAREGMITTWIAQQNQVP